MWIYRMKAFIVNGSSSQMLLMPLNRSMCRTRQLDQCSLQHVGRHDFSITRKISIMSKRLESDHLCRVSWHTRTSAKNKTVFQHIVPFNNQKPAGNHCNLLILQFSSEPKKKKRGNKYEYVAHCNCMMCVCACVCPVSSKLWPQEGRGCQCVSVFCHSQCVNFATINLTLFELHLCTSTLYIYHTIVYMIY